MMPGPPMQPGYGVPAVNSPGYGSRIGATIIDALVGLAFSIPGAVLFIASFVTGTDEICRTFDDEIGTCREPNVPLLLLGLAVYLAAIVLFLVMYSRKVGRKGQSWGHKAMGYKIVDEATGGFIGSWKAFGRYLLGGIINYACYIDYLWPLWDKKKQRLVDKALNTIAVKV